MPGYNQSFKPNKWCSCYTQTQPALQSFPKRLTRNQVGIKELFPIGISVWLELLRLFYCFFFWCCFFFILSRCLQPMGLQGCNYQIIFFPYSKSQIALSQFSWWASKQKALCPSQKQNYHVSPLQQRSSHKFCIDYVVPACLNNILLSWMMLPAPNIIYEPTQKGGTSPPSSSRWLSF